MIHPCAARPVSLVPGCLDYTEEKYSPSTAAISAANRAHITIDKLKSCTATRILQSQPQVALQRIKSHRHNSGLHRTRADFDFLPHQPSWVSTPPLAFILLATYFGRDASLGPDGRRRRGATAKPLRCMCVIRTPARGRPVGHFHVSVSASLNGEADGLHPYRVAA
ncbi:hypothetical protein GE21DRAFT_10757 [Neurospora crassa]|uniref:Uncharacterized protein n=1 Tax=Neurospora crassa (strain ATCC 24698 / 74-OR23-1A / CBS 708.71 / DSM 1257 / FGSC 987) TaxID=367110 RepID=Q7S533_NEUCR|nr:hypothetical protein NCU05875 [Neurospora crassa OR74A]EAA30630.3 hypothetical protein NCU05875 [Neurospora crassa OR74A]KHE83138.1 hypothetical protein GE21DRAFT_10757 [Neurospora crassa]|eukprot:XP_959866.3 hypothetical protein NCU05875 [Neurospora crassa OR74A]